MLPIDERELLRRLKLLARLKPAPDSVRRTQDRVRKALEARMAEIPSLSKTQPDSFKSLFWRTIMKNRTLKFGTAAAILLIVSLILWFLPANSKSALAFAQVIQQFVAVRTLTAKITSQAEGHTFTMKLEYLEPGWYRITNPWGGIQIMDATQFKSLTLIPREKKAILTETTGAPQQEQGPQNYIEQLRRLQHEASTDLGEKQIDGRITHGFKVDKHSIQWTIWADPETGLPIRVESSMAAFGGTTAVMTDFQFNPILDESLFSLTPPPGYWLETQQVDASPPTEKDLIEALSPWVKFHLKTFPAALSMQEIKPLFSGIMEAQDKAKTRDPEGPAFAKNFNKTFLKMMRGSLFVATMKPENDWHYVGKNVIPGRSDQVLCWWKPAGATTYRVLYADLTLKDLTPDELKTKYPTP